MEGEGWREREGERDGRSRGGREGGGTREGFFHSQSMYTAFTAAIYVLCAHFSLHLKSQSLNWTCFWMVTGSPFYPRKEPIVYIDLCDVGLTVC